MSKDSISDYDTTAASNTDVGGVNIDEGCSPANINDAIRIIMSHLAAYRDGRIVGTNIQGFHDNLAAFAGLTLAANKLPYATGSGALALADFTDFARGLMGEEDAAAFLSGLDGAKATQTQAINGTNNATWMTPERVKQAIDELTNKPAGSDQTWQDQTASRAVDTSYQNTTGRTIMVSVALQATNTRYLEVSSDDSNWITVGTLAGFGNVADTKSTQVIIPDQHYYRATGTGTVLYWSELR